MVSSSTVQPPWWRHYPRRSRVVLRPCDKGAGRALDDWLAALSEVPGTSKVPARAREITKIHDVVPIDWITERRTEERVAVLWRSPTEPSYGLVLLGAERPALKLLEDILLEACRELWAPGVNRATLFLLPRDGWALPAAAALGFDVVPDGTAIRRHVAMLQIRHTVWYNLHPEG